MSDRTQSTIPDRVTSLSKLSDMTSKGTLGVVNLGYKVTPFKRVEKDFGSPYTLTEYSRVLSVDT